MQEKSIEQAKKAVAFGHALKQEIALGREDELFDPSKMNRFCSIDSIQHLPMDQDIDELDPA